MGRKPTYSPAAIVLAQAGITQRQIAQRLGCSKSLVSAMLAGTTKVRPALLDAVADLGGPDAADRLAEALDSFDVDEAAS